LKIAQLIGKVDSEDFDIDVGLGLLDILNVWVKEQYAVEMQPHRRFDYRTTAFP